MIELLLLSILLLLIHPYLLAGFWVIIGLLLMFND